MEFREEFESRRLTEEQIIAALNDDSTIAVGIIGIGKTRMATRIGERLKREKVFRVVMMVSFEGGGLVAWANELLSKLTMQERVLVILDDVHEFNDLGRIRMLQKHKIMITSPSENVCLAMGCNVIFTVAENDVSIRLPSSEWMNCATLQVLNLTDAVIEQLPVQLKKLRNLRLLNLTNCRNLHTVESGLISSLVRLEELYMLGSFSNWEVEEEGKRGGNASINELEVLVDLKALQIQTRQPSIIPKSSGIWSRLILYVISTPEELKCRYQESLYVGFPAVTADEFRGAMNLHLPAQTLVIDWICVMLRTAENLCLSGVGSKITVDELIPHGFKLLKWLYISHCSTMEYLVDKVPLNGLFPSLESLCLEDLPLLKEMFDTRLPVGFLFRELRNLKLCRLPALLHVFYPFCSLISVQVSHCPKLRSLFSLTMAGDMVQLENLIVEDCCIMQQVLADDGEAGKLGMNESLFPRLRKLELRGLFILKSFCHVMNELELPSLEDLTLYDCQGMKEFSGGKLSMPVLRCVRKDSTIYRIDDGTYSIQHIFNEKHLFVHHYYPLLTQSQAQQVEEIMEEDGMTEPILSHLQRSSQASGDNIGANLHYDIDTKNVSLISKQNTITEEDIEGSVESYLQDLGEKREDEGASMFCFGTRQIEEMNDEANSDPKKRCLEDFILFCSSFPLTYFFTKDIIVWQWIGAGLVDLGEDERMEEECTEFFDTLLGMDYILPYGCDYFQQPMYKIGDKMTTFLQNQVLEPKFVKCLDSHDPTQVELLSLTPKTIDTAKLGVLKQYNRLQTLVIHDCYLADDLPNDLFSEMKTLKILNLSCTNIKKLPSSIVNLTELQFFDISKTSIEWLYLDIITCCSHLQTLNIYGCMKLEYLPAGIVELINLRHLILEVGCLTSMPEGIGKLSNLRTLSAFVVDKVESPITEVKNMNKLRGSLCLLNLEDVETEEEALEACLYKKVGLRKIELQWGHSIDEANPHEERILESLQPPPGIQELRILCYCGGVLPSWICNPSFSELDTVILRHCRYLISLPSLGELPSLKHLTICQNKEVVEINNSFFRKKQGNDHDQHGVAFPKLEKLVVEYMSGLEKWTGLEKGDFPSLRHLEIRYCPKFVGLPSLSRLDSLSYLEIWFCPELVFLHEEEEEEKLPRSLESLKVYGSPKLKEQCCDEIWFECRF